MRARPGEGGLLALPAPPLSEHKVAPSGKQPRTRIPGWHIGQPPPRYRHHFSGYCLRIGRPSPARVGHHRAQMIEDLVEPTLRPLGVRTDTHIKTMPDDGRGVTPHLTVPAPTHPRFSPVDLAIGAARGGEPGEASCSSNSGLVDTWLADQTSASLPHLTCPLGATACCPPAGRDSAGAPIRRWCAARLGPAGCCTVEREGLRSQHEGRILLEARARNAGAGRDALEATGTPSWSSPISASWTRARTPCRLR